MQQQHKLSCKFFPLLSFRIIRMGIIRAICQRKEENLLMTKQKTSISCLFPLFFPPSSFFMAQQMFLFPRQFTRIPSLVIILLPWPHTLANCQYEREEEIETIDEDLQTPTDHVTITTALVFTNKYFVSPLSHIINFIGSLMWRHLFY
jgi:hypothetical protein